MSSDANLPRFLLVDGHSVIHAWKDLRALHMQRAKRYLAREELLKRMRLLQDVTGERVVVVFDGVGSRVQAECEKDGVQVFYSDDGISADGIIERLVAKYSQQYPLRVCTADGMIWETTGALGSRWVSPEDLEYELAKAGNELDRHLGRRKRR